MENIDQPLLAAALREILEIAGLIVAGILIAPNMAICATIKQQASCQSSRLVLCPQCTAISQAQEIRRSYTPNLEG